MAKARPRHRGHGNFAFAIGWKGTARHATVLRSGPSSAGFATSLRWASARRGRRIGRSLSARHAKPSALANAHPDPGNRQHAPRLLRVPPCAPPPPVTKAKRLLAEVAGGADPSAQRHEAREALTVAELCDRYLGAARAGLVMTRFHKPKRASTIAIDEGRVSRHIAPLIGKLVARDLPRAAVQHMADAIAAGKTAGTFTTKRRGKAVVEGGAGTAARVVELLGGIWSWGEKRGFVGGPSPTRGVETHRGEAKDRVLSPGELAALGVVLREHDAPHSTATAALRLIALTGLRREEACALRWREIDPAGHCLRLETTKTGRSTRPIGKAALDLLSTVPHGKSEWVFPNRDGSGRAYLKKSIADLFNAAALTDARSHDLRRTFGSLAADEGYGDATIAELLGHARRGVTARHYIRRPDAALIAAADSVAERIAASLDRLEVGEVIELRKAV